MKTILFLAFTVLCGISFAQNVGINATGAAPVTSAALDVDMVNRGILIPRVALTTANAFAPVTGVATVSLLVYNTVTAGIIPNNVIPGYYYWDGTRWVTLGGVTGDFWRVGTNAATTNATVGTGFLGTTNNNHVDLVSNNIVRGRLSNLGEFFIGTTTTALMGDLMNGVANATFPWAVNGYSAFDGSGIFGLRLPGSINTWGAVQGELAPTLPANSNAIQGGAGSNNHRGVMGQKPAGGTGWGGLFLNDLGYTGFFGAASDERVKTDIKPIEGALNRLMKLEGKTYRYAAPYSQFLGGDDVTYGFIAQDVEALFPEMVKEKSFTPGQTRSFDNKPIDIDIKAVSTITLIPVLVEAIKEQQAIIEEMKKEIEALKKAKN